MQKVVKAERPLQDHFSSRYAMYDVAIKQKHTLSRVKLTKNTPEPLDKMPPIDVGQFKTVAEELCLVTDGKQKADSMKPTATTNVHGISTLNSKFKNLSLNLPRTKDNSRQSRRSLSKTCNEATKNSNYQSNPYQETNDQVGIMEDQQMTIKVIDGNNNISGGSVIQSFKPYKPKRNISVQFVNQAASANSLTLPKISETVDGAGQAKTDVADLKCALSTKLDKYQSMSNGSAAREYYHLSPRTDEQERRKHRNLTSLET